MFWCLASSTLLGLVGVLIYVYYLKKGQFDDPEDVKYQMFREEENPVETNKTIEKPKR